MKVIIVTALHKFVMDISGQETVYEVKQKIENTLGIPIATQTLTVLGWELIDGLSIDNYPIITEGTRIDLTVEFDELPPFEQHNKMQIIIKFSSRVINMEVERTETVRGLKEKIHIIDGTPINRMSLYFSGLEMEEELSYLSEYGITDFSEVAVVLKSMSHVIAAHALSRLNIVVQTSTSLLNGARIPLQMKDSSTVSEVRELLLTRGMLPIDDYIFIHKQRIMRDKLSLRWHGVENGDYIYVFKGTITGGEF